MLPERKLLLPLAVYLLLALILMWPLLGKGYFITLDMQFGPNSFSDNTFPDFYGLSSNPYGANLPLRLALDAVSRFIGMDLVEKALLFSILFLCGASMHLSLPEELGDSRYFAGLLYMLNPFVFVRFLAGHWSLLLSYAFWPMALMSFIGFLDNPSRKGSLVKTALLCALASVSSHGILLLLSAFACVFIVRLALSPDKRALLGRTLLLGGAVLLLNMFWIVPSLLLFSSTYSPAPASAYLSDFGSSGGGIPLPLALLSMHGFWRGGFTYTKDVFLPWQAFFIAIAAIAYAGLLVLLRRNDPLALSLPIIFMLAFLLALGSASPLAGLFSMFGDSFPLYFIFRDTQKFVGLMCLVYSLLGAYGANHALQMLKGRASAVGLCLLLSIILISNFGFFGFLGQARLTQYPDDWMKAEGMMSKDTSQTNILVLPLHSYMEFRWVNSSSGTIGNPAPDFFSKPVIAASAIETSDIYSDSATPQTGYLASLFPKRKELNNTAELLLPLDARYIIVMMDQDDSLDWVYLLYNKPGVELLFKGDTIMLFRNDLARGMFFGSTDPGRGNFSGPGNPGATGGYSPDVSYEAVTPAYYRVSATASPYVVYAGQYLGSFAYSGSAVWPWHGIGSAFQPAAPGVFENRLFYLSLSLFLLSWAAGFCLLSGSGARAAPGVAIASAAIFLLSINGIITLPMMGALLVLSAVIALALRYRLSLHRLSPRTS